jgi:hypothetical protein
MQGYKVKEKNSNCTPLFLHKACWILLFVSFSYRIHQCVCSFTIRFVPCAFFINKQFRTCANAFPNEFTTLCREFFTPKIVGIFYMQGYKVKEKNSNCTPVSKLSGHPEYSYDLTVNSFRKTFAHVRNCLLMKKAHGTNRMVEEWKHWRILYENDTKRRIQQALCKNKKKRCTQTL